MQYGKILEYLNKKRNSYKRKKCLIFTESPLTDWKFHSMSSNKEIIMQIGVFLNQLCLPSTEGSQSAFTDIWENMLLFSNLEKELFYEILAPTLFLPRIAHWGGLGKWAVVRWTNSGNVCWNLLKGDNSGKK